jgi:high-affinity iron transporter
VRRLVLLLVVVLTAVAAPANAAADDGQFAETRQQIAGAKGLVEQAVDAARAGDRERGYELAREAYLDHFELAEVPLRLRDPNLVLDLEFTFAELRNGIRDGAPVSELEQLEEEITIGLRKVDRVLADPGFAAPLVAFLFSFSILFREGVEAVLLVAILLGSLEAGRASGYRKPLGLGVLAAVVMSAITWVLATLVLDIAPLQRELLEGVTAVVAVAVLFVVTFWLVAQLEQRRRMEFMRARVAGAIAAGSSLAFAGLGFTAVYREGFETVLFYQALTIFADGLLGWVLLGIAAAAVALAAVGWAVLKLGKRLPVKQLLLGGASMLLLLSVAFAGNAVRSLQEGDWLPVTPIEAGWARLPVFLAELTGIHPTRESIGVQIVLLSVYVVGATWMFLWQPLRRRAAEAAQA